MIPNTDPTRGAVNFGGGWNASTWNWQTQVFFSCVSTKASPAANMPWGFLFRKNEKMQFKVDYIVYTKIILNETYSDTIGTLDEWGVQVLLTQESFVQLEKSQSAPLPARKEIKILKNYDGLS